MGNVMCKASRDRDPHISPSTPRVGKLLCAPGDARTEQRRASELHHTTGGVHKHKASCSAHFKHTHRLSSDPPKKKKKNFKRSTSDYDINIFRISPKSSILIGDFDS